MQCYSKVITTRRRRNSGELLTAPGRSKNTLLISVESLPGSIFSLRSFNGCVSEDIFALKVHQVRGYTGGGQ